MVERTDIVESVARELFPAVKDFVRATLAATLGAGQTTMLDLSRALFAERNRFTAEVLQALIERIHPEQMERRKMRCPGCHTRLFRKRRQSRPLSTLVGSLRLRRPYFHCATCERGFCPLDDILGLAPETHQYDVQEQLTLDAARLPYLEASGYLERHTGIKPSASFAHATLNRVGEAASADLVLPSVEEIERRIEQARAGGRVRPVLVAAADGAHTPIRASQQGRADKRGPGEWHEAKGFRLYLLGPGRRIVPLASWHQVVDHTAMAEVLGQIAARVPADKVRVALVGDGAPWVWNILEAAFPDAVRVLDRYHCAQYLWGVADVQFGDDRGTAHHWVESVLAWLDLGEEEAAFGEVLDLVPSSDAAEKKLALLLDYLGEHIERFDYTRRKRQGFPIGSGAMESANRFIMQDRIRLTGAWWIEENCNTMLRIRCAIYNGTFARVFQSYMHNRNKPVQPAAAQLAA